MCFIMVSRKRLQKYAQDTGYQGEGQLSGQFIFRCTLCRRFESQAYKAPAPPPPPIRVQTEPPFTYTGVDFAGPLYVKTNDPIPNSDKSLDLPLHLLCHQSCKPRFSAQSVHSYLSELILMILPPSKVSPGE